jgi:probable rRNA maturation factor
MRPALSGRPSAPEIDIQVASPLWRAEPKAEETVREAIAAVAAAMPSTAGGEVSIVLTDDEAIRALNRQWRGIDKATNVLSFPAAKAGESRLLGDIVIAYETLRRECDAENLTFHHHLAHLTVHGYLHLIGYDHQDDAQAEAMEALESRIMTTMNMPDPWLGRDPARDIGGA